MADNYASYDDEELVDADPDQKNWKGIGIALLVIGSVCSLIITAIVLLTPEEEGPRVKNPRLALEDVLQGRYEPRRFNGTWVSDTEFVYKDPEDYLILYNVEENQKTILMSNSTFRQLNIQEYRISPDRKYVLLAYDIVKIFKYSYKAKYKVYNISNEQFVPLLANIPNAELQYADWGRKGSQLVYVYRNSLYYIPQFGYGVEARIVHEGIEGVLFNGIPDWTYEVEILGRRDALWWSAKGTKLCYASFDNSAVDVMTFPRYGSYNDVNNVYPEMVELRYPKAGKKIPQVTLWIIDFKDNNYITEVKPPKDYMGQDYYFTALQWVHEKRVSVIWMKRFQNSSTVSICDYVLRRAWICKSHLIQQTNGRGWVEMYEPPLFADNDRYYFIRLPVLDGNLGHYRHVAMVNIRNGKRDFLTYGQYDVSHVLAHTKINHTLYYISTLPLRPGERHFFAVTDREHAIPKQKYCITCDVDEECKYVNVIFSKQASYYILECLGPGVPRIELRSTDGHSVVAVLDSNSDLADLLITKAMPQQRTFTVPLDGGYSASVHLTLPPGLRDEEIIKYPLIVNVDPSPGNQLVNERFQIGWGSYLASARNFVYAWIDGRGSGYQGDKRKHEVYRRLGHVEIDDQLTISRYLKSALPFIDQDRTAIWGWAYGGYATVLSLAKDSTLFCCGIAVAPIVNWLYYDSVYTERYMQMPWPVDNYIGYEKADMTKRISKLQDRKLLLVHGTADDNVHVQQSLMLMKALTDAGVIYRTQVYPDESHNLRNVKSHMYRTMEAFIDHCFDNHETINPQEDKNSERRR